MFVWQVADLEAKRLQAAFLEPPHLLLGLCKCVDIDVAGGIPADLPKRDALVEELLREFRVLHEVFHTAGFNATRFRRYYRTVLPEGSAGLTPPVARLHRDDAARDVFAEAERIASISGGEVYPVQLLWAVLAQEDSQREEAIAALGSNEARLRRAVQQRVFSQHNSESNDANWANPRWN